ncbi:MAG: alpha/beta hydrolase [Gammaproteobacteria bacterium]|nr:alpha/beta hydrolase [Gammaproteobacteria bacterium]
MTTRKVLREALMLDGPAGALEALLEEPREPTGEAVAVLCHPHPQFQGTMLNKVVHTLSRVTNDLGSPAVRFNFRGVGASDGEYGQGLGEADDVIAVAQWARARYPGAALWLAGFSFGGVVASRAALTLQPAQLISIASPAGPMAEILDGQQPDCPWLLIQGDADEVVDCDAVIDWVNGLAPGPELLVLSGVDHFFHGKLTLLRQTLVNHLTVATP